MSKKERCERRRERTAKPLTTKSERDYRVDLAHHIHNFHKFMHDDFKSGIQGCVSRIISSKKRNSFFIEPQWINYCFLSSESGIQKWAIPRGNYLILNRLTPLRSSIGFTRVQFERGCIELTLLLLVLVAFSVAKGAATTPLPSCPMLLDTYVAKLHQRGPPPIAILPFWM